MPRLRISLVTPSLNHGHFIERAIQSVLTQKGEFDLEYFVIDGGSRDNTLTILPKYTNRLIWRSEPDKGQSDAINKGLRWATGDVVGWLNSDDLVLPGALERVAHAFRNNPQAEWLHGRCTIIDTEGRVIRRWISAYKDWCGRHYSYSRLLTENFIQPNTAFWRRSLLDQVGYLDINLNFAMDYDLWLRLARRSDPVYIREPITCFRWYPTSKSGGSFRKQFQEDFAVARRHEPRRHWILLLKRYKSFRIVTVYRILSILRLFRSLLAR